MSKEPKGKKLHWEDTGLNQLTWLRRVDSLPSKCKEAKDWKTLYELHTYDGDEPILYMAKGYKDEPNNREVVWWYRNGYFHGSYGLTFIDAIKQAIDSAIYVVGSKP
jgi:hypothetical protein